MIVVTLADAGRLDAVRRQARTLEAVAPGARHVLVALGDADLLRRALPRTEVHDLGRVHLAAGRNLGGDIAARDAADDEAVLFLDADCLPGPELLPRCAGALRAHPQAVVCGPVTYLPEGDLSTSHPRPHPARPNPPVGVLQRADARGYELFWSLSFALTAGTWRRLRVLFGGFDEGYEGYGAEDTDLGQQLRAHGVPLLWAGGAHAFHQWHPVSSPPWEHLDDILVNAARFERRWGFWPMSGWLEQFAAAGAIELREGRWARTRPPRSGIHLREDHGRG